MHIPMKFALAMPLALAAAVSLTAPAHAGGAFDDIVVTSPEKLKAWQDDTNRVLNRALEREPRRRNLHPSSGIVQMTFELGDDGKPDNIELQSNTANRAAARTARHALRWLGDISDVPVTNAENARFIANIIFARSVEQHQELQAELEKSERARLASGDETSEYIALGG